MKYPIGFSLLFFSALAFAQDDAGAIAALLSKTFDKPDAKVVTQPVVIAGDHAVADWVQGHHGGRALLARQNGNWKIVACGGGALAQQAHLVSAGVPEKQAAELAGKLAVAEARLDQEKVQIFDSFKGERAH